MTIEFYRKELQERSKLLENQQILSLESNKKIQRLESELEEERQLNYSANKRQDIEVQETMDNTDSIKIDSDNQEEKKFHSLAMQLKIQMMINNKIMNRNKMIK